MHRLLLCRWVILAIFFSEVICFNFRKVAAAIVLPLSLSQTSFATLPTVRQNPYDTYAKTYDNLDKGLAADVLGLSALREEVGNLVKGDVLEVAVGTGIQLEHYDWTKMQTYVGIDSSRGMLSIAQAKLKALQAKGLAPDASSLQQMEVQHLDLLDNKVGRINSVRKHSTAISH